MGSSNVSQCDRQLFFEKELASFRKKTALLETSHVLLMN